MSGELRAECITPILCVRDLQVSLEYYTQVLGFQRDWSHETEEYAIAGISWSGQAIYLCRGDQGRPGAWVWVGVNDAQACYERFRERGAVIRHPPRNYPWGLEARVEDPDGNVLRYASDSAAGRPFDPYLP